MCHVARPSEGGEVVGGLLVGDPGECYSHSVVIEDGARFRLTVALLDLGEVLPEAHDSDAESAAGRDQLVEVGEGANVGHLVEDKEHGGIWQLLPIVGHDVQRSPDLHNYRHVEGGHLSLVIARGYHVEGVGSAEKLPHVKVGAGS